MNPNLIKKPTEIWKDLGRKNKRMIFFFQNKVLDLTQFRYQHPGGKRALDNYTYKDITDIIFKVYPHSEEIVLQKLEQYVIGFISDEESKPIKSKIGVSKIKDKSQISRKKVCFNNQVNVKEVYGGLQNKKKSKHKIESVNKQKKSVSNGQHKNKQNQLNDSVLKKKDPVPKQTFLDLKNEILRVKRQQIDNKEWDANFLEQQISENNSSITLPHFIIKCKCLI